MKRIAKRKDSSSGAADWATLTGKPSVFPPESHNHDADYAALTHNHDASYAALVHNHDADYAAIGHNHDSSYASAAHGHTFSEITQTPTTLSGYGISASDPLLSSGSSTRTWSVSFGGRTASMSNSTSYYTMYRPEYDYWGNIDTSPTSISAYDYPAAIFTVPADGVVTSLSISGYGGSTNSTDAFKVYLYKAAASNNSSSVSMIQGFGLTTGSIRTYGNGRTFANDSTFNRNNAVSAGDRIFCWIKKDGHRSNSTIYMSMTLTGEIT